MRSVPATLAGNLMGGTSAEVDEVKVLSIGSAQTSLLTDTNYWQVRAKGSASVMIDGDKDFDGDAEFNVGKTPCATWAVSLVGL